ncbi:MAG: N-acetylmuramoyl-L-alanine amidase [Clostridia bacterium]|nr:N-acetylmuramoyl-L-alanine amidase [Clostridia bacterium]
MKKLYLLIIPLVICSIIFTSSFRFDDYKNVKAYTNPSSAMPTIIIDPGHGGFDGGALTNDGYPEKNINLRISLYLKAVLELWGYNTVITRDCDTSLEDEGLQTIRQRKKSDIYNRMALMESIDNAIFISIHQNHYSVERYSGAQVFYSRSFSETSSSLAESIQESIVSMLQPDNTRLVKECGDSVYLMYNAVKPAVLVECGFLSNNKEAELLKTDEYNRKMAFCIASGIQDFILGELYGKK